MEASNTAEDDKCDESQQQLAEDSDEDLCHVNFPIKWDTDGNNSHNDAVSRPAASINKVDEDATIRCFNLSVNAHTEKRERVAVFEPMLPKNNKAASSAKDENESQANDKNPPETTQQRMKPNSEEGDWLPASLPLPSWAANP
eukprot:CAMPEP_0201903572 /NCGR_PEP_ID=MMETSP0902-20130614/55548_1 /ASSEMBLY_ACC=CAM_ASM_000551 /TAXON_ID=420261 /ORGANISM="Thalassiosira antarctica, Strain CCMP982" /LENGTH=142 /DNA_ID=CAMNT_0048437625 /DNA_START=1186 /DNA_END=1614 /DNA_ORIENTATION=+